MTFLANSNLILQISHAKTFKRGILRASTIILSKDIDKYAFMCGSNFNETDVYTYLQFLLLTAAKFFENSDRKTTGYVH